MENFEKLLTQITGLEAKLEKSASADTSLRAEIVELQSSAKLIGDLKAKADEDSTLLANAIIAQDNLTAKIEKLEKREKMVAEMTGGVMAQLEADGMAEKLEALASGGTSADKNVKFKLKATVADMTTANIGNFPATPAVDTAYFNPEIADTRRKGREVYDAIPTVKINTDTIIESYETDQEGTPTYVAVNGTPEKIDVGYTSKYYITQRAPAYTAIDRKMLKVVTYIQAKVEQLIRRKLMVLVTQTLIDGDGTGNTIYGLKSQGTAFSAASAGLDNERLGTLTSNDIIEILEAGMTQMRNGFFEPNVLLIDSADTTVMKMRKTTTSEFNGMVQVADIMSKAIPNQYVGVGKFVILDTTATTNYVLEDFEVELGWFNDTWLKNQIGIKVEMNHALVINPNDANAVIYGDYATAATDLNTEDE